MSISYEGNRDSAELNSIVASNRREAYLDRLGGWEKQLEMIFDDIDNWRAKINEIKTEFPKV
jgi:hypothetical protein